jgi:hypothetical protein
VRKRLWFLGLILVLAIPLVWVLKDFAREAIATPLLYVLWIGDLFFQSIPQVLFWTLFLASALIVAGRSLIRGKKPAQQEREVETVRKGQVQVLTRWLHLAAQEDYFEWRLARHLGELTSAVLAQRERTAIARTRQHLRDGELDLPSEVQDYLQTGLTVTFSKSGSPFSRLLLRLRSRTHTTELDPGPENVVQFLENQLEV